MIVAATDRTDRPERTRRRPMRKSMSLALVSAATLALTACHREHWGHGHADTGKITADIKAQEAQWEKDYAAKNPDALAGHYADNAALGSPGVALATDSGARHKELEGVASDPNLKI